MSRRLFALGLLVAVACTPACAPTSGRVKVAPPPIPSSRPEPIDTCGLKAVRNLVGQPKSAIPVPVTPGLRRVTCSTCVQTQDYNPRRLNIYFDVDTGIIQRLACG
jgi:hypothetical protein